MTIVAGEGPHRRARQGSAPQLGVTLAVAARRGGGRGGGDAGRAADRLFRARLAALAGRHLHGRGAVRRRALRAAAGAGDQRRCAFSRTTCSTPRRATASPSRAPRTSSGSSCSSSARSSPARWPGGCGRRCTTMRTNQKRTEMLYDFSKRIAAKSDLDDVLYAGAFHIAATLNCRSLILMPDTAGDAASRCRAIPRSRRLDPRAAAAARWAFDKNEPAGAGTPTLPTSQWMFAPLADHGPARRRRPAVRRSAPRRRSGSAAAAEGGRGPGGGGRRAHAAGGRLAEPPGRGGGRKAAHGAAQFAEP